MTEDKRCGNCNRLLFKIEKKKIAVKCPRCKEIEEIPISSLTTEAPLK